MCYIPTKSFQLFQFVYPTSRYTTQDHISMLYVLRIFKLFLEYHDRLLSHDISFTLPTFYQYAYRAITTVLACTRMILKCNGISVTKLRCGIPTWSLIDRIRQNPFPTLLSSIYRLNPNPAYVTKNTQFNYYSTHMCMKLRSA